MFGSKKYVTIDELLDFITNIDTGDLSENYALAIRGFRLNKPGMIGVRDFGTIHRYVSYPSTTQVAGFNLTIPSENKEYDIWVGTDSANNLRIHVYNDGTGMWEELTRVLKTQIASAVGATSTTATIGSVVDILGVAVTLGNGELRNYIAVNQTKNTAALVTDSTATTFTSIPYLGSSGLGWASGDTIVFYRMTGILPDEILGTGRGYPFLQAGFASTAAFGNAGTDPHVRWTSVEVQNKVNMLFGTSDVVPRMRQPVQIRKSVFTSDATTTAANVYYVPDDYDGERPIHLLNPYQYIGNDPTINPDAAFVIGQTTTLALGTTSGWYIDKSGLLPDYQSLGTATGPKSTTDSDDTIVIGEGVKLTIDYGSDASATKYHTRFYVTALYRGTDATGFYQESDPIAQVFLSISSATGAPKITPTIKIDLAMINKSLAGFKFYEAVKLDADIPLGLSEWTDTDMEYIEVKTVLLTDTGWSRDQTTGYSYTFTTLALDKATYDQALASIAGNISDNLGHPIDKNRSYLSPRYGVEIGELRGSRLVYDQDDRTLRLSAYSGDGIHMDDSLPDITADNLGGREKINLFGHGEILGLAHLGTLILVFRNAELETYDLISNDQNVYPIDCYSKKSIIGIGSSDNPSGVAFAGKSGIYIMPSTGSQIRLFNPKWVNMFDGTLMTDDGVTPYTTDTMRKNVVFGYDPTYRELWCNMTVNKKDDSGTEVLNFRYSFDLKKWYVRELNISGTVKFFSSKKDGTFIIGVTNGLLKYPNRETFTNAHAFEDDVALNADGTGTTAHKGIPTNLRINVGKLYSLDPRAVLSHMIFDFKGESEENSHFDVNFYTEDRIEPYDTISYRTNEKPSPNKIKPIGAMDRLAIEIVVPSAGITEDLSTFQKLELSKIELGVDSRARKGNA